MSLAKFSMTVALVLALTTPAIALVVRGREDAAGLLTAALAGSILAALNAIAAFALVLWSRQRSTVAFMRAILGGMTLRMAILIGASAVALRVVGLPQGAFLPSLLVHFALFLALELAAAHRAVHQRQAAQ